MVNAIPLEVYIFGNNVINMIKNGLNFENLWVKELQIMDNIISSSGFLGALAINTRSTNQALFQNNKLFANMKIGLCIENSKLLIKNCRFSRSITGIWINFGKFNYLGSSDKQSILQSLPQ
jgi:hypothetical protein